MLIVLQVLLGCRVLELVLGMCFNVNIRPFGWVLYANNTALDAVLQSCLLETPIQTILVKRRILFTLLASEFSIELKLQRKWSFRVSSMLFSKLPF